MNFEKYYTQRTGIHREVGCNTSAFIEMKAAWNAALEEAAKWADMTGPLSAKEIRTLKGKR